QSLRLADTESGQRLNLKFRFLRPVFIDPLRMRYLSYQPDVLSTSAASWHDEQPFSTAAGPVPRVEAPAPGDPDTAHAAERASGGGWAGGSRRGGGAGGAGGMGGGGGEVAEGPRGGAGPSWAVYRPGAVAGAGSAAGRHVQLAAGPSGAAGQAGAGVELPAGA